MENVIVEEFTEREEQKIGMKERIADVLENVSDFVKDHSDDIYMTILYGGTAVLFGQSIRYMHLLNKNAKKGNFFAGNFR